MKIFKSSKCFLAVLLLTALTIGCRSIDHTKGKSDTCQVHHVKMTKQRVPIYYGLPAYSETTRLSYTLFPNADAFALGGCVVMDEKHALVYVCPKCQAGLKEFKKTNEVYR